VAHGDATHARRVQIDVVGARAPHRDHLEAGATGEDAVREPGVGTNVDGDLRPPDAADELLLLVGAALGEDGHVAQLLRALVSDGAVEHRGEIVRDADHAWAAEKMAWAADTPAPASHL